MLIFAAQIVTGATYAAHISINSRRRQFMPKILFVVGITGDNICRKKKSPAYIVAVALYFYLYFLFIAFFIWLMVQREFRVIHILYVILCFKYKNKVIIEWRFISIFLFPNLSYQTYVNCYFKIGLPV